MHFQVSGYTGFSSEEDFLIGFANICKDHGIQSLKEFQELYSNHLVASKLYLLADGLLVRWSLHRLYRQILYRKSCKVDRFYENTQKSGNMTLKRKI